MRRIILVLFFSAVYLHSFAGWEIVTRYYSSLENPQEARQEYVYISVGYMKIVSGEISTIFNLKKQEIVYLNTSNKKYWQGNSDKFNADIRVELRQKIDQELHRTDKNQQDNQKQMYEEMLRNTFTDESSAIASVKNYPVKRLNVDQTIAGYKSYAYQVLDDVMPLETVWIAPDLKIASEFDFRDFSKLLQKLVKGAYSSSFENSVQYFKLLDEGYPLKVEMRREDGQNSISEVIKVSKINLEESVFKVPQGYQLSSLTAVGVWDAYQ